MCGAACEPVRRSEPGGPLTGTPGSDRIEAPAQQCAAVRPAQQCAEQYGPRPAQGYTEMRNYPEVSTRTELIQVDAFTDRPFHGNPAAVCLLSAPRDALWMQQVAQEMNLSETAFLHRAERSDWTLRWFTPTVEVDLCGHATLAGAHALWETGLESPEETIRFTTRSGLLTAVRQGDWIELDFPATPGLPAEPPPGLAEALGCPLLSCRKNAFDYLVEVESEAVVRSLSPDFARLARIEARGIMVTSRSDGPPFDFVSRFFAPASGIDEDPVTGSAHCCLGPYWQTRLAKSAFLAHQVSARTGVVRVTVEGDRVRLGGQAVTVLRAELADGL